MKKIYLILSVIAALAVLIFLASRFMPAKYITGLLGKDNAASSLACSYPTYLALSKDKIQSKTIAAYGEYLKDQIRQSVAGVSFSNENIVKINNREAFAMEGYVRQNQTNFKILTAALKGDGDEVWVFNFNTVENKWENNAPVFEQILNSFSLK